ncbi:MAG: ABC transporter permease [Verrucomicrobiota bacterium]
MASLDSPTGAKGVSLTADALRRLLANRMAVASLVILGLMFFLCFVGAWFCPDPDQQDLGNKFSGPSGAHWLGTDHLGRDFLSRILFGGQISLLVGLIAATISLLIGVVYGGLSGYLGGKVDSLLMRIVDILYALPFLLIVILLKVVLDENVVEVVKYLTEEWKWDKEQVTRFANIVPLFVAIGILGWLTMARITRAQVLAMRDLEFVEAARSLGLSHAIILFRHILPNILGPIIIYTTLTIPSFILYEASLSYLGLGVAAPDSSWGILLDDGANYMETNLQLLLLPGIAFSITLFALNFLGDGLRDALDVKSSKD